MIHEFEDDLSNDGWIEATVLHRNRNGRASESAICLSSQRIALLQFNMDPPNKVVLFGFGAPHVLVPGVNL